MLVREGETLQRTESPLKGDESLKAEVTCGSQAVKEGLLEQREEPQALGTEPYVLRPGKTGRGAWDQHEVVSPQG